MTMTPVELSMFTIHLNISNNQPKFEIHQVNQSHSFVTSLSMKLINLMCMYSRSQSVAILISFNIYLFFFYLLTAFLTNVNGCWIDSNKIHKYYVKKNRFGDILLFFYFWLLWFFDNGNYCQFIKMDLLYICICFLSFDVSIITTLWGDAKNI